MQVIGILIDDEKTNSCLDRRINSSMLFSEVASLKRFMKVKSISNFGSYDSTVSSTYLNYLSCWRLEFFQFSDNEEELLWILLLGEHEVKSSFDSKHEEIEENVSQSSDEVVLSEKGSSEVSGTGELSYCSNSFPNLGSMSIQWHG